MKEFIPEIIKLEINKLTKVSATDNTLLDKNPIRHCMYVQPKPPGPSSRLEATKDAVAV